METYYLEMILNSKFLSNIVNKEKVWSVSPIVRPEGGKEKHLYVPVLYMAPHPLPNKLLCFSRGGVKGWNG